MRKLHFLQAIRAVAASLVVADHAMLEITADDPRIPLTHVAWTFGQVGVDGFFVVSGFIMTYLSWDDFGRPGATAGFLRRRLVRIVPLYWLATLAAFAFHRVAATHGADEGWWDVARSLAFLPYRNESGGWFPVLAQGWTLSYEMMFYAAFAAVLFLHRGRGLLLACAGLVAAVLVGRGLGDGPLAHLAAPISLWFVLGVGLGAAWRVGHMREPRWLADLACRLELLGDASYSVYLVHGMVLTLLLRLWRATFGVPSLALVPVTLVAATLAGIAVHRWLELPLQRWLRARAPRAMAPVAAR